MAERLEPPFDHGLFLVQQRDHHVAGDDVVGQGEAFPYRMVAVHDADQVVGEQSLPPQPCGGAEHGQRDVGPASFEVRVRVLVPRFDTDLQLGRGQEQPGQQVRPQRRGGVVGADDAHDPGRRGGVEAPAGHEALQPRQEQGEFALHFPRARGQLVVAAGADQKLVAEQRAQPLQRAAHGRLAQVEHPSGPGHVSFLKQDGEGTQFVQQPKITMRHTHSMRPRQGPYRQAGPGRCGSLPGSAAPDRGAACRPRPPHRTRGCTPGSWPSAHSSGPMVGQVDNSGALGGF